MFSCHVARLGYDNPKKIIKTFFKNLIANIFISKNVIPFIYFKIRSPLHAHIRNIRRGYIRQLFLVVEAQVLRLQWCCQCLYLRCWE